MAVLGSAVWLYLLTDLLTGLPGIGLYLSIFLKVLGVKGHMHINKL